MKTRLLLRGRSGLGDAIYLRPVVRAALVDHTVQIDTCWPELYSDLPVEFVEPRAKTRDPKLNAAKHKGRHWSLKRVREQMVQYRWDELRHRSVLAEIEQLAGVSIDHPTFDLPPLPGSPVTANRIAVIRPVTLRKDWPNPARNCEPSYMTTVSKKLLSAGFHVVSVANAHHLEEPIIGRVEAHQRFEHGELELLELLALVQAATIVVGPVGWIIPACLATRTPLIVIAGGCGGANNPKALLDPRVSSDHIHWLFPDNYCQCLDRSHECPKHISFFSDRFTTVLKQLAS
jgi:hypothetical protein